MKTITLICSHCSKTFERSLASYKHKSKRFTKFYCSPECQRSKKIPKKPCICCGKETYNPKYCSMSCAAKIGNKNHPKRKLKGKCISCNTPISSDRKYCKSCHRKTLINYDKLLLKDLKTPKGSRNSYHTCIRQHSKSVASSFNMLEKCKICGYNKYVECCHIKPVSSFPEETTLSIVNAPSNLIGLCPNHHKEFDLGLLQLS